MYTRWCAKICRNTQTTWEMSTTNAFTIDWLPLNCRRNCIGNKMNISDSGETEKKTILIIRMLTAIIAEFLF